MDQPIAPAARVVDRERTHIGCAKPESVEDDLLCGSEPILLAHQPVQCLDIAAGETEMIELRTQALRLVFLEERQQGTDDEGVEDLGRRI